MRIYVSSNSNFEFPVIEDLARLLSKLRAFRTPKESTNEKYFMTLSGLKVSSDGEDDFFSFNSTSFS